MVGGLMFALIGIVFQLGGAKTLFNSQILSAKSLSRDRTSTTLAKSCETPINETSRLSRQQLLELLAVPERDSKSKVTQIVKEPYCQLSSLKIRAGVDAQRDAYPLEFDPQTTLVILYENDEYAGYRFKP
ncbi:MAG: hypothetical protein HC800_01885 [Phormidesmis sp. RL_2_1]|nr:hypothetical protein [Phormidesmis sp. RL_2_1]